MRRDDWHLGILSDRPRGFECKNKSWKLILPLLWSVYERALPLPTSSPLMHNQLSKLTYLPEAREAHGTRPAVVQNNGTNLQKNLLPDRPFPSVWFSSLLWHWLTLRVRRVHSAKAEKTAVRTHTSTPAGTCLRTHTHTHPRRPKGGKGTKEKQNDLHAS